MASSALTAPHHKADSGHSGHWPGAAWERGQTDAQSTVVELVGGLASDDFNLLWREVRRLIRSGFVAISEEMRQ